MKYVYLVICFLAVHVAFGQKLSNKKEDSSKLLPFSWYTSIIENDAPSQRFQLPAPSLDRLLSEIRPKTVSNTHAMPIYDAKNPDPSMQTEVPKELPKQFLKIYGKEKK